MKKKRNKISNLLKLGILLFGISLLLYNCQKENDIEQEILLVDNSIPLETVSIDEAKNFLNSLALKNKSTGSNDDEVLIVVDPNWNTIEQDSMKYSDALLTHVTATFKTPRTNNYKADVLFIKVEGELVSVLYSTFPMDDGKEIVHITELNGDFIDSYIVEDGLFLKRLFFTKEEIGTKKQAKNQKIMEYPPGCEDISNIVASLENLGFLVGSCSPMSNGSGGYNIYGQYENHMLNETNITGITDRIRNYSNRFPNMDIQDCETTDCNDQYTPNEGGGSTTTTTRTELDKQRELAARIAAQKKKCSDQGMLYVNGECVVDTEAPCPIAGDIRNDLGKCERPCPAGFVIGGIKNLECVPVADPCKEIKDQIDNTNNKAIKEELEKLTSKKEETGYVENKIGTFTKLPSIKNGHSLSLAGINYKDIYGFTHTHLNNFLTGKIDKKTGLPIENKIYRMFSPADVIALLNIAKESTDLSKVYATIITSTGNYTLRFTGNKLDIFGLKTAIAYKKDYLKSMKKGKEKGFLQFLKNHIKVKGIELYKLHKPLLSSTIKIQRKSLDSNGKVDKTECE